MFQKLILLFLVTALLHPGTALPNQETDPVGMVPTSDDAETRQPGSNGKVPAVGNTVDVANATWTNTIGDPELITVWEDPDFDPDPAAFYYVRVIEIPTPRWTAYDAKRFGLEVGSEVWMTLQERAYTSPIWYTP